MPADGLSLELVDRVRESVTRHARRTPLLRSTWLSDLSGAEVWLKCESLQRTGSFKLRGALAALALMDPGDREAGVLTCSAGNHGAGLALAAQILGLPCRIVVPRDTPEVKLAKMRERGAAVTIAPCAGYDATQRWTLERLEELGGRFVHPFEDPAVMAGNGGTTALEILEDLPTCDAFVVPCGGGGCICGMGVVAHAQTPAVRTVGVNTDASPGMWLSRKDGRAHLEMPPQATIAEGLEGGVGEVTFRLGRELIDEMALVREADVRRAVALVAEKERLVIEGSAAAGVAAVMGGLVPGRRLCVVLSGSNIDMGRFRRLLAEHAGVRSH